MTFSSPAQAGEPKQTAATTQAASADIWSSRKKTRKHVKRKRSSKTYGFAYYFANQDRIERNANKCFGNRVVATWYQAGHRTASGARFNPDGHTAAHRTMPFGSRVTVTNPRNGRSITVTINDRGPFTRGVSLDLARGAARSIGMTGTQQVCMS